MNEITKKHYWVTPPEIMQSLKKRFQFDFDPCPFPKPDDFDGLAVPWGKKNWVNPPFTGGVMQWIRKAISERDKGNSSVIILPLYQNRGISVLMDAKAEIEFFGKPRFLAMEDLTPNPAKSGDLIPCVLCILQSK
jgi:hypothetical protein